MPQQTTPHLFIYRMTHIDNVPFIVKNGLWSKLSPVQDPNFIPIGNPDIIDKRTNKTVVVIPPGGVLGEYVPYISPDILRCCSILLRGMESRRFPRKT